MTMYSSNQAAAERYSERLRELAARDPQIAALMPTPAVQEAMQQPGLSTAEIIEIVLESYADRAALGERRYEIASDPATGRSIARYLPAFDAINYGELRERIAALASAWRHHKHHRVTVNDFVCVIGFSGIDFAVIDMAISYVQAVAVPLQAAMGAAHLEIILKDTAAVSVAANVSDLALATQLAIDSGTIRSLIVFDYDPRIDADRAMVEVAQAEIKHAGVSVRLITLQELIDSGRSHVWHPLPRHPEGGERLAALIHSSGSTGTPKGVMMPERAMNLAWLGTGAVQVPIVGMVFAPMNHFMGRHQVFTALTSGGVAYYTAESDLSTLFEDIRLARPTFMSFFPRIFELIYQSYKSELVRRSAGGRDVTAIDAEIRAEMRTSFLGDRLRGGTIGSAPCAPEVKDFVRECFDIFLIEGYGSTESGIFTAMGERVVRPHVISYKLRDVPELGYYRTDKPYPRGELLVKSRGQSLGYFKRPEATAAVFDAEGYVITGDIMEERGSDHLVCIDRRNDVLKLSQAEFVAVGPLGATLESGSELIKQIYLYGNSVRSYLLAVVVPELDVIEKRLGRPPTDPEIKTLLRVEIQKVAREGGLRTFEVPRDFIVDREPFSVENGLLSSVRKRMRSKLKEKYGERLESLYTDIERKREEELLALKDPNSPFTTLEKVVKALEASLGIDGIDLQTTQSFADLGGDSLGTVAFSMFLQDLFGVEVPVNAIISPASNPQRWADMIEKALHGDCGMATFDSVHGKGASVLYAKDLTLERFFDAQTLAQISTEPPGETRTVLLTGANGFLGRFLCLTWMERLAPIGGKVICVIRANDDAAARKRLDDVFIGVDADLASHYRSLASKHLEVLAGDFAEPGLGLTSMQWERLANEVDHIVHPGALVNHVLSYGHLFGPNVFGTAELIRLALTRRRKRFDFISSMAAAYRVDTRVSNDEDAPLLESIPLSDVYADGYGATKWAAESLLHNAHHRYGLPVNIFRGDMIMPHTHYAGQINVPDMITRLLYSIVVTELAPASFYESTVDGRRAQAHFDGLPVDFLAAAIVGIGAQPHRGVHTYNTINHHVTDGASLDAFVDWIESAGYTIERVGDHAQWRQRFETKLQALTESQRQHSSLAILDHFRERFPASETPIGSQHFVDAVRKLPIGPSVPHLTEEYIHKYLADMHRLGLISHIPRKDIPSSSETRLQRMTHA